MGLELDYIPGQTPLDEDEKEGLKIPTITTRKELDEFEQLNIEKAVEWSLTRKIKLVKMFFLGVGQILRAKAKHVQNICLLCIRLMKVIINH